MSAMTENESAALDRYQLIPRVLHGVEEADTRASVGGRAQPSPLVPHAPDLRGPEAGHASTAMHDGAQGLGLEPGRLRVVDAGHLLPPAPWATPTDAVGLLRPERMGDLMPKVRSLNERGVAAIGLDLAPMADSWPFGREPWRPRTREDLAELRGAAGVPLWLFGVASAADAEVAAEAGADVVVVQAALGARLGTVASIDLLPEVIDAVGGMLAILAGGPVRDGIDVLRYLAVGAEAVVVAGDRALGSLEAELRYAMRITGCAGLEDIGYEVIFEPMFGEA